MQLKQRTAGYTYGIYFSFFYKQGTPPAQKNGTAKGVAFETISKHSVVDTTVTVLERNVSSLVYCSRLQT